MSVPNPSTPQTQFVPATIGFWTAVTNFNRDNRVRDASPPLGTNLFKNSIISANHDLIKLDTIITDIRSQRSAIIQRDIDSNFQHYKEQYRVKKQWCCDYADHEERNHRLRNVRDDRLDEVHLAMFEESIKVGQIGWFITGEDLEARVAQYDSGEFGSLDTKGQEDERDIRWVSHEFQVRASMAHELRIIDEEYAQADEREKSSWEVFREQSKANLESLVMKDKMDHEIIVELKRVLDDEMKEVFALIEDELLWFHNHAHMAKWTVSEPA